MDRIERMLAVDLYEDAARTAYMACFHLAQAYIFERTDKVSKTHHGVQTEFFRLTRDDSRTDGVLRCFLTEGYQFKTVADYATGDAAVTSAEDAADAVGTALQFIGHFEPLVDAVQTP